FLLADGGGEVDGVLNAVAGAGIDSDELVALVNFDRFEDAHVFTAATLYANPFLEDRVDVGLCASVENGQLEVIDFDDDVVDAHADEGREQMLGGGDEHALPHEAGGVANLGDVAADGGNFEVVEIGAAEDDA